MKKFPFFKVYFGILGAILVFSLGMLIWDCVEYERGVKTEATIRQVVHKRVRTGNRLKSGSKRTDLTIEYSVDGSKVKNTVMLSGHKKFSEGQKLLISYNPENPEKVIAKKKLTQDISGMVIYAIFVISQVVLVIKARKSREKKQSEQAKADAMGEDAARQDAGRHGAAG